MTEPLSAAAREALIDHDFYEHDPATKDLIERGLVKQDGYDWNVDDGMGGDEYPVWIVTETGRALLSEIEEY